MEKKSWKKKYNKKNKEYLQTRYHNNNKKIKQYYKQNKEKTQRHEQNKYWNLSKEEKNAKNIWAP